MSILKMLGLARELSTYMDDQSVVVCSQLIMQIKLTAKGTSQIKEVLSVVFSYIIWLQNLDNLPNYFFEEIKTMKDINFKYRFLLLVF